MRHSRGMALGASVLGLMWLGSCDTTEPPPPPPPETLIVSDSATTAVSASPAQHGSPTGMASAVAAQTTAAEMEVAYISLPPESYPDGVLVRIRSPRIAGTVTAPMIEGGLDPVAVPATAGDNVEIEILGNGGVTLARTGSKVPERRRPRVVRTVPPRGKTDVAVNAVIVVVFSEPVAASSLSSSSVQLFRGTTTVAGTVRLLEGVTAAVAFQPSQPLNANTEYRLVVGPEVRDLDGDPLEGAVSVEFTTGSLGAGLIAFERITTDDGGNNGDIYVMNPDGTGVRRLTNSMTWGSWGAAWSPDGKRLAFVSQLHRASGDQASYRIYVMNADGSGITKLTNDWWADGDDSPAWSPDGARIVFTRIECVDFDPNSAQRRCLNSSNPSIYLMNADGSAVRKLIDGSGPAWSPDASRIVFTRSLSDSVTDLYVMNDDGSGVTRLTNSPGVKFGPTWSPNGSRIAFHSHPDQSTPADIYVMNADGSGLRRLTDGGGESPTWSADGSRIAFTRFRSGVGPGLLVMNADGTAVTDLRVPGHSPTWSPSGIIAPRRPAPTMSLQRTAENNGDGQADTVLVTLAEAFRVQVYRDGAPAPGVLVSWRIRGAPEGSSLSASAATSDASGVATTTLTFGSKSRGYVIEASAPGANGSPVFFGASAGPGNVVGLAPVQGNDQVGMRGKRLGYSYIVRPFDSYGNTVEGVGIDWAVVSGGGSVVPLRGGQTTYWTVATHTLGPDLGPQTVTATVAAVSGAQRVTFTAAAADRVVDVGTTDVGDCHEGFSPQDITVPLGSTVGWGWILCDADGDGNAAHHDVTFEDDATQPVSSPIKNSGHHVRTFMRGGTHRYRCTLHSTSYTDGEVGKVTVSP